MKKLFTAILILVVLLLVGYFVFLHTSLPNPERIVIGTGNPGKIVIYSPQGDSLKKIKEIITGYNFVYTTRIGDIFNNGKKYLIAGVGNDLGGTVGCKVLGYDLSTYKQFDIDTLEDLRCKDLTIGDADNDGKNDILLVTHGRGIVRKYTWDRKSWIKETIDDNFIGQMDEKSSERHRVPNTQLPCSDCIINTAIHIVKIADIDRDGKNEILTTVSSPLELQSVPEVTYLVMYKKVGQTWQKEVLTSQKDTEYRGIAVGDLFNDGTTTIVIGSGSTRKTVNYIFALRNEKNKWVKHPIYSDSKNGSLKSISIVDLNQTRRNELLFSTAMPDARVMTAIWTNNHFKLETLANMAKALPLKDAQYTSMDIASFDLNSKPTLINVGFITYPGKGPFVTKDGFLTFFQPGSSNKWMPQTLSKSSVWALSVN